MRKTLITLLLAACLAAVAAASAADDGKRSFKAELNGYNEVVGGPGPGSTGSVSTAARGIFRAQLRDDPPRLEFTLTYADIEGGDVTAAHPHFAQRHVAGDIFTPWCGGLLKPPCPTPGGTVEGTISPSDITGPTAQGVVAGDFDEFVGALRAGAVYINVHSPLFPEGEIRGQVGPSDD